MPEMLLKLLQKEQFKTVEVTGDLVGNKIGDENESTENFLRKPKTTKKKVLNLMKYVLVRLKTLQKYQKTILITGKIAKMLYICDS